MATNLAIDEALLRAAQELSGMKTKKETVNLALKEFIQRRKQEEVIDLFGTVVYEDGYDYKSARSKE